jgi:hypothetical protein
MLTSSARFILRALCALFVAGATTRIAQATTFKPHHLYVAVEQLSGPYIGETVYIARYPLNGWSIGRTPDLVIPGYAGPLAIDEHGTLYAGSGQLTVFQTSYIAAFHFGSKKPFTSFPAPLGTLGSSVMADSVNGHGLLSFAYIFLASGSASPITSVATYRTDDGKLVSNAVLSRGSEPQPIYGMAFDNGSRLYLSFFGRIYVYAVPSSHGLKRIGSMFSTDLHTPGGLATTLTNQIYVADLPAPGKVTVSSYLQSARGEVSPLRLLVPIGLDSSYVPAPVNQILAYGIALQDDKLFLPFYTPMSRNGGGGISGVYEYSRFEAGNSRVIDAIPVVRTPALGAPYVAESVAVGP